MVGNDVVDLRDPEVHPEALHPRFDARVFGPTERAALAAHPDPHRLRWTLWACKEAAYKAAKKLDARATFSPRRFRVQLDACTTGEVTHGAQCFPVKITRQGAALHVVARARGAARGAVLAGQAVLSCAAGPGGAARALALGAIARWSGAPQGEFCVVRRGRIPVLLRRGVASGDLSLSHHGRFVAFAWTPPLATEMDR